MLFGGIISSPRDSLLPEQALKLANTYLDNARETDDPYVALVLCHDTEVSLSQAKKSSKRLEVQVVRQGVATAYDKLGKLLDKHGRHNEAQAFLKKAVKIGERFQEQQREHLKALHREDIQGNCQCQCHEPHRQDEIQQHVQEHVQEVKHEDDHPLQCQPTETLDSHNDAEPAQVPSDSMSIPNDVNPNPPQVPAAGQKQARDLAKVSQAIFARNIRPPALEVKLPKADERLNTTLQLATSLSLLKNSQLLEEMLDPPSRKWLQALEKDTDEQERLKALVTDVIRAFQREEIKNDKAVAEILGLAPVLEKGDFQHLLRELCKGFDQSILLDEHQLDGIAQLIRYAEPGYLDADDLVKILGLLNTRLRNTHRQSSHHMYQLIVSVSRVLDVMADSNVEGLDREKLHEPLCVCLSEIKKDISDPYLAYQVSYAYQALLYVPDDETPLQATMRRTCKVIQGVAGLVSAVKGIDFNGFMDGLKDIQQGISGATGAFKLAQSTFKGAKSIAVKGKSFVECMKEGLSVKRKLTWYSALRGAEALLRSGQLANFRRLVCEAPCRLDPAFQWGVCQLLGDVATNPMWDAKTRRGAVMFLGEMYNNRTVWENQADIQERILVILIKLASLSGNDVQVVANEILRDLESKACSQERESIQACRKKDHSLYPLRIASSVIASPSLIDRAQDRPDVEGHLRQLKKQHLMEQGNAVYIPPQAKAGLQASDESRFQLMEKVEEFLNSEQKVFLLLGEPGAGKSTFSRALDQELWRAYKKDGGIPLHVNLPAIDKPEHDMIAKQLRRSEFTEPQIRELKMHRKFILICDGYDESQQTHNLYATNLLNEPGEWKAKMIISCRTEYLGTDYRDRFQPGDRNNQSKSAQFQEAVMTPFSESQIDDYINDYVAKHQPLWEAMDYKEALSVIPSLKELVKNPFLMTLSLEVMPRMMDPGEHLSATHVTKVGLYDHFIEHWLERGKKRLGEKKLNPQSRAAFESLIDEGFTRNGIDFLKKLAVAIYKEQDGQPIVEYSRYKDEHSWKSEFFSRDDEKQLLREACPLTRNGNQYRFIHRSLLEYGLALAVFDPYDWQQNTTLVSSLDRRGSVSSVSSFEIQGVDERDIRGIEQGPDLGSPLAWRSFVNEHSLVRFLEERVQQEPVFKQQLLDYIEYSKVDKKWRRAAANAITILTRAGVEFRSVDLQGIQIPGADLSHGVFDSAKLQGADLRKVNLSNTWLRGSDLSGVQMKDVQFGELPYLKYDYEVRLCMYSPDGSTFAVALYDDTINVYTTSNWERTWSGHSSAITDIAYSPNGDRIVSGSWDRTVRVWDIATGNCLYIFIGHSREVYSVAYSPQGNVVASRSPDDTVRLWDVGTGYCRSTLSGCGSIYDMSFSPSGDNIAFCTEDYRVRLWDVVSGECQSILTGYTRQFSTIKYSRQGDIVCQDEGGAVGVWEVEAGAYRHVAESYGTPAISPKGNQIATYNRWGSEGIDLYDTATGERIRRLALDDEVVNSVAYSPQGDQIVSSGTFDKTVRLWDVETGECRQTMTGHTENVWKVLYSPKGDHIASVSFDRAVRLWNVGSGSSRKISHRHSSGVTNLKYSPKRNQIASCSWDSTIRLWDVETGVCSHTLTGHGGYVWVISYSPQEDQLVSCSRDKTVRLWDVEGGGCRYIFTGHTRDVNDAVFSPQGNQIASTGDDGTVRLWDLETRECQHILIGHSDEIWFVKYSPQGNQVASCSMDGIARLWDVVTGDCQHTFTGHSMGIGGIEYSPNGNHIASASDDKTVRLWDVKTGMCSHIFIGHQEAAKRVVYSPRGDQVASASHKDRTVRLWDLESGECCHTLVGHEKEICAIAYTPRGDLMASWSDAGEARLWDVETGNCRWTLNYDQSIFWNCSPVSHNFVWMSPEADSFITGGRDGSVRTWEVIEEGGQSRVRMRWRSISGQLGVEDTCVQDVQGLSHLNRRLLKQRGATGEPNLRLRDAGKNVVYMTSVVSKLKSSSSNTESQNYV